MAVFVGFDVHRAQITFDALDTQTGEVRTGRVRPIRQAISRVSQPWASDRRGGSHDLADLLVADVERALALLSRQPGALRRAEYTTSFDH